MEGAETTCEAPWKRWFSWRIAIVVCVLLLTIPAYKIWERNRAINTLQATRGCLLIDLSGLLQYDRSLARPRVVFDMLPAKIRSWLLRDDPEYYVFFSEIEITEAHIEPLRHVPNLAWAQLENVQVDDEELVRLALLPDIKSISLAGTQYSEVSIQQMKAANPTLIVDIQRDGK